MGVKDLHIWDDDFFEERNGPKEIAYSENDVGKPKVEAAANMIKWLVGDSVKVTTHQERVTTESKLCGVVISGVDSMKSRRAIWSAVKEQFLDIPLYIDGRSSGEFIQILSVCPADFAEHETYESWLLDDNQTMQETCGARNIGYISAAIAAEISCIITRFSRQLPIEFNKTRDFEED